MALALIASLEGPDKASAAEIERRAYDALANPEGGEDWSAARAEIESKLRRP